MQSNERILRRREVSHRVGLSPATVYRMECRGDFPKRVQIGERSVGWRESEVLEWIAGRSA